MKFNNNRFLIFYFDKEGAAQVSEIIRKKYPEEKNNSIESVFELSDALTIVEKHRKAKVFFDIIVMDLHIPLKTRKEFIKEVTSKKKNQDWILVANDTSIKKEDKKFIEKFKMSLIPNANEFAFLSLLEEKFLRRFNEKKFYLINRIDSIVNLKIDSKEILDRMVEVTLAYLGLKICWISLVDYETRKLKVGTVKGFGKYEEQYKRNFDISLSEKTATTGCIRRKKQMQYRDVQDKNCPFKYKGFAEKIGLKSILLTPILGKGDTEKNKVVATLNLYTDFFHEFQEDECELARLIASKMGAVLSMKGVYEEERDESRKKLDLIEQVAAEINKNVSDPQKVFEKIVNNGIELVQADRGCIKLCNEYYITCEYHVKCKKSACKRIEYGQPGFTNYVVKQKKSLIVHDIHSFPYRNHRTQYDGVSSRMSVPLMLDENKVIGVLTAEHKDKNYFTTHHQQLFEALARHAVIAIENTKRYERLQKRLQSQLIIKKLIEETSKLEAIEDPKKRKKYRVEQLDRIIEDAIRKTGEIFNAESGFVALAGFKSNLMTRNPRWQFGLSKTDLPELEIGVLKSGKVFFKGNGSLTGKVVADGKVYNCGDVTRDPFYLPYSNNEETKSEIVIPLKFQEETFGAFALDSNYENGFLKEDEEILESIATQMALLIKRFGYLNTLMDLDKPFKKIHKLEQLYKEITNGTTEALATRVSYLRILNRDELIVVGCTGIDDEYSLPIKVGEGVSGRVAESLKSVMVPNVQDESYKYKYPEFARKNFLYAKISVPIVSTSPNGRRDLVGVLNTYANRICNFTSLDLLLMQLIAEKAGEAIKNARLIKQLESIAKVDEKLTTTTEKDVLKDIANIAKKLLDADQVVLYQYNSNIKENFGYSANATVSGEFKFDEFKSPAYFTKDSLLVLLLDQKNNEFFIESYEKDLIEVIYINGIKVTAEKPFYQREQLKSAIILKLTYRKEVVGILFINYRYQKSFSSQEKRIARTFANKAAIAISNIRKYEDIGRLHTIGNVITSESDIDRVLDKVASNSQAALNADIVILHRYDKINEKAFHPPVQRGEIYKRDAISGKYSRENVVANLIKAGKDIFARDVKKARIFRSDRLWEDDGDKTPGFTERERIMSCSAMLLKVRQEIVGAMFINYRKRQAFDIEQKRIIKIIATQAAIAIRNANLIEESRKTINRISTNIDAIQKSGYSIVKNLNKEQVTERDILRPILEKALKIIGVDMGYIGLSNKEERNTKIIVCSGRYKKLRNKSLARYYPESEWIKRHEKFDIFSGDSGDKKGKGDYKRFADNPQFLSGSPEVLFTEDEKVQSALRIPIYSDKEFLGMIVLESEKKNAFSEIDAFAVMSLANQASMALQNYKLIQQLRSLRDVDTAILKEQNNLENVLEVILKAALKLVKKEYGNIKLLIDDNKLLIKKSHPHNAEGKIISVNECLSGIAILEKKTFYEKDVSHNKKFLEIMKIDTKSELVIPLLRDEELIGVLNIESPRLDDFTDEDIKILEMLSDQTAIAIYLAQQKEKLVEKEKEASIGYVTRESVHWVGNKIGPISRRVENINNGLMELYGKGIIDEGTLEPFLKDLSIIKKGANSALSIKSDLIDDASKEKVEFNLIMLLKDTIDNFKNEYVAIEIKNLSIDYSLPYSLHFDMDEKSFQFIGDSDHTGRVFHYILKNAYQAIEDKVIANRFSHGNNFSGEIFVTAFREGNYLIIEFKDNGIGVKREDETLLFRPFHTTKGADRGSGVGLYFCKRTMEALGGKIYLKETEYGKGTTFCLAFPLKENKSDVSKT